VVFAPERRYLPPHRELLHGGLPVHNNKRGVVFVVCKLRLLCRRIDYDYVIPIVCHPVCQYLLSEGKIPKRNSWMDFDTLNLTTVTHCSVLTHSLDRLTGDGSLRPPELTITGHVPSSIGGKPDVGFQLTDPGLSRTTARTFPFRPHTIFQNLKKSAPADSELYYACCSDSHCNYSTFMFYTGLALIDQIVRTG